MLLYPSHSDAGRPNHWLNQARLWSILIAVGLTCAILGATIAVWADAQAAKVHRTLTNNIKHYQSQGGSAQVAEIFVMYCTRG